MYAVDTFGSPVSIKIRGAVSTREIALFSQSSNKLIIEKYQPLYNVQYTKYPPPDELKNFVRYFWSYDVDRPDVALLQLDSYADRFPRLIYQDLKSFEPIYYRKGVLTPTCYLSGAATQNISAFSTGRFFHFGVSFYPHGFPAFFSLDCSELTDKEYSITDIEKTTIGDLLDQCVSHRERVVIMNRYLVNKLKPTNTSFALMHQLIHSAVIDCSKKIHELQKETRISERQMERLFKTMIGISPKKYQRILRFEKALTLLNTTAYSGLAALAYDLYYSDQAHFINDFKKFSGITPYEFVQLTILGQESSSFIRPAE